MTEDTEVSTLSRRALRRCLIAVRFLPFLPFVSFVTFVSVVHARPAEAQPADAVGPAQ